MTPLFLSKLSDQDLTDLAEYQKQLFLTDMASKGFFRKNVPFPAAPTFGSPVTIIPSQEFSQGLFNYTLIGGAENSGGDVSLNGNFSHGFSIRRADGDASHKYRFKATLGTILGGASGTEPGFSQTDYGNYQELYGDSLNSNPMVVKGERGVFFGPRVGGAVCVIRDVVGKSNTAATFQANGDTSGGSYYASITQDYCRSFLSGQEATAYFGKTSAGGATITLIRKSHNFGYSPYRDGWQIELCDDFIVSNETIVGAGRGAESGQTNNFQIICSKGVVKRGIYDNAGTLFTIFANGVTIQNNYLSASLPGYIGKSDDLTTFYNLSGLNVRIDGSDMIIENNYFKNKGAFTYAFEIAESLCNIIIRNNVFDGYTNAYLDSRGAHTNTITGSIGNNGNTSASVVEPTYSAAYNDADNYAQQGLLAPTCIYVPLHFGYRTA